MNILNLDLDAACVLCVDNYRLVRDRFCSDLAATMNTTAGMGMGMGAAVGSDRWQAPPPPPHPTYLPDRPPHPSHEILIAEADETLALAEEQSREGWRFEASQNYHTACIYYR